jgi:hypothetical protein
LLQPIPGTVTTLQLVALQLLHFATIYPGQEVFTGAGRPNEIPAGTCFRITGRTALGREVVLFDDLGKCRAGSVEVFKDPFDNFQARRLEHAFRYVRSPAPHKNLNEFPLVYLYAIADYYCRNADLLPPKALAAREDFWRVVDPSEASEGHGGTERPLAAEGREKEQVQVVQVQMLSQAVDYETRARRQELTEEGFLRCGSSQWVRP